MRTRVFDCSPADRLRYACRAADHDCGAPVPKRNSRPHPALSGRESRWQNFMPATHHGCPQHEAASKAALPLLHVFKRLHSWRDLASAAQVSKVCTGNGLSSQALVARLSKHLLSMRPMLCFVAFIPGPNCDNKNVSVRRSSCVVVEVMCPRLHSNHQNSNSQLSANPSDPLNRL